jgi:hypothetical protein
MPLSVRDSPPLPAPSVLTRLVNAAPLTEAEKREAIGSAMRNGAEICEASSTRIESSGTGLSNCHDWYIGDTRIVRADCPEASGATPIASSAVTDRSIARPPGRRLRGRLTVCGC